MNLLPIITFISLIGNKSLLFSWIHRHYDFLDFIELDGKDPFLGTIKSWNYRRCYTLVYSSLNSRILVDPLTYVYLPYSFLDLDSFCECPYSTFISLSTAIYLLYFQPRILVKVVSWAHFICRPIQNFGFWFPFPLQDCIKIW